MLLGALVRAAMLSQTDIDLMSILLIIVRINGSIDKFRECLLTPVSKFVHSLLLRTIIYKDINIKVTSYLRECEPISARRLSLPAFQHAASPARPDARTSLRPVAATVAPLPLRDAPATTA